MKNSTPTIAVYRYEGVLNDLQGRRRDGVEEGVAETKQLVDGLGLVSTYNRFTNNEVKNDPLLGLFDEIVTRTAGRLVLQTALAQMIKKMESNPASTVVVEANPSGIHVAKNIGCRVIGLKQWGAGYERADIIIPIEADFISAINQHISRFTGHGS